MRDLVVSLLAAATLAFTAASANAGHHGGLGDRYIIVETCYDGKLDCVSKMDYRPGQSPSAKAGWHYWYGTPHCPVHYHHGHHPYGWRQVYRHHHCHCW